MNDVKGVNLYKYLRKRHYNKLFSERNMHIGLDLTRVTDKQLCKVTKTVPIEKIQKRIKELEVTINNPKISAFWKENRLSVKMTLESLLK